MNPPLSPVDVGADTLGKLAILLSTWDQRAVDQFVAAARTSDEADKAILEHGGIILVNVALEVRKLLAPAPASPLERLKREVFAAAEALSQPADLTVQLMILAELRERRLQGIAPARERAAASDAVAAGLSQLTPLGDANLRNEEWRIGIEGDKFHFCRYVGGERIEAYRLVGRDEAGVWAAAIIDGFEPPPRLRRSDKPTG